MPARRGYAAHSWNDALRYLGHMQAIGRCSETLASLANLGVAVLPQYENISCPGDLRKLAHGRRADFATNGATGFQLYSRCLSDHPRKMSQLVVKSGGLCSQPSSLSHAK